MLYQCDMSPAMAWRAQNVVPEDPKAPPCVSFVADEEMLPCQDEAFSLVMSNLSLHWVNKLPDALDHVWRCLEPNGMFIASMLGGDTLFELRTALMLAEQEVLGGVGVHISPMAGISDAGGVLAGAEFSLPAVDRDTITIWYPDCRTLMRHLSGMGESNAVRRRRPWLGRGVAEAAERIYQEKFGGKDGVPATFEILYLCGWKPHPSQQQPDQRGSATVSLKEMVSVPLSV